MQSSPTVVLPKPGFPQRIAPKNDVQLLKNTNVSENTFINQYQDTSGTKTGPFDYLYEFSETRKVLEDFFKSPDTTSHIELQSDTSETVIFFFIIIIEILMRGCIEKLSKLKSEYIDHRNIYSFYIAKHDTNFITQS